MLCPECRGASLVTRIVALDNYLCCLACHYTDGPLAKGETGPADMAFA